MVVVRDSMGENERDREEWAKERKRERERKKKRWGVMGEWCQWGWYKCIMDSENGVYVCEATMGMRNKRKKKWIKKKYKRRRNGLGDCKGENEVIDIHFEMDGRYQSENEGLEFIQIRMSKK